MMKRRSLAERRPDLVAQWHPTKNGLLSPGNIPPYTRKKAWWICARGHEWSAVVSERLRHGCPYCSGKYLSPERSLACRFPELAAQWHPTKNGFLTPADVFAGSSKVAWWICSRGHEWTAVVGSRRYNGCPYCGGTYVAPENSLAARHPELVAQWHPTKNGSLLPSRFLCGSQKKAWWRCEHGHEWLASIITRTSGRGCPYCAGLRVTPEKSLARRYPALARQWHPDKNGKLTPWDVSPKSAKKVWWRCHLGHEWETHVGHRVRGNRCPYCARRRVNEHNNLQALFPQVARQWHPEKNGSLTPADVLPATNRKVWWRCAEGHEWRTTPNMRTTRGTGCPYCTGMKVVFEKSLAAIFPAIAAEWHPTLNQRRVPGEVSPHSNRRVWWLCPHGHAYPSTIRNKVKGSGCPDCQQTTE